MTVIVYMRLDKSNHIQNVAVVWRLNDCSIIIYLDSVFFTSPVVSNGEDDYFYAIRTLTEHVVLDEKTNSTSLYLSPYQRLYYCVSGCIKVN